MLALLRSTPLTEEQITEVVHNITADGSPAIADGVIDRDEIAHFISELTHHDAGPENIRRVAATLAAVGWPLAGIDVSEVIPGDEWGKPRRSPRAVGHPTGLRVSPFRAHQRRRRLQL